MRGRVFQGRIAMGRSLANSGEEPVTVTDLFTKRLTLTGSPRTRLSLVSAPRTRLVVTGSSK
jgi:hypothetical protein